MCSENAVVSPENLQVCVRLQNAVVSPENLQVCVRLQNAVVSPENLQVCVRLQNAVATPINNRTACERNRIKDSNTGLTTVFCCCVNVAYLKLNIITF